MKLNVSLRIMMKLNVLLQIYLYGMTQFYLWHGALLCVTWLIHMCDMTHSYVWHGSFIICFMSPPPPHPTHTHKHTLTHIHVTLQTHILIHVSVCVCIYVQTKHTCVCVWLYTRAYKTHMCVCVTVYTCIQNTHVCVCDCIYVHTKHTCVCVWLYIRANKTHMCVCVTVYTCIQNTHVCVSVLCALKYILLSLSLTTPPSSSFPLFFLSEIILTSLVTRGGQVCVSVWVCGCFFLCVRVRVCVCVCVLNHVGNYLMHLCDASITEPDRHYRRAATTWKSQWPLCGGIRCRNGGLQPWHSWVTHAWSVAQHKAVESSQIGAASVAARRNGSSHWPVRGVWCVFGRGSRVGVSSGCGVVLVSCSIRWSCQRYSKEYGHGSWHCRGYADKATGGTGWCCAGGSRDGGQSIFVSVDFRKITGCAAEWRKIQIATFELRGRTRSFACGSRLEYSRRWARRRASWSLLRHGHHLTRCARTWSKNSGLRPII